MNKHVFSSQINNPNYYIQEKKIHLQDFVKVYMCHSSKQFLSVIRVQYYPLHFHGMSCRTFLIFLQSAQVFRPYVAFLLGLVCETIGTGTWPVCLSML